MINERIFYFLVFGVFLLSFDSLQSQSPHLTSIYKWYQIRDSAVSFSYHVDFKMKSFSQEDTVHYIADVELLRKSEDALFLGWLSVQMDSIWLGYDGKYIYKANRKESSLQVADAELYPEVFIKSTFFANLIEENFLTRNHNLVALMEEGKIPVNFTDTLFDGAPCLGILVSLPDQDGFTNQEIFLAIDTSKSIIIHRTYRVEFQENVQYQEWRISNGSYGMKERIEALDSTTLSKYSDISFYARQSSDESQETETELSMSNIQGNTLHSKERVSLFELEEDYILLDFWYAACYPCIKSIPHVNKLYDALKGKDVAIYGVNPIDRLAKDATRLEKFLRNNPMSYPTIMPDEESRTLLEVPGYPTFLILDQDRKVIYSSTGYSETLYEEVMTFLKPLLD